MAETTSHFGFTKLVGTDNAGWNSINSLITSVDTSIYAKVCVPGMIMMWDTTGSLDTSQWTNLGATPSGLPALSSPYVYIKKKA